ncbi:MAG: hypothetical protein ACI97A_002041 [Planctomycetota bacterium]
MQVEFRAGTLTKAWPVKVDGISIGEDNLKKMVIAADCRITSVKRKIDLADLVKLKTSTNLKLIDDKIAEL